jgi:hypothetical protein
LYLKACRARYGTDEATLPGDAIPSDFYRRDVEEV